MGGQPAKPPFENGGGITHGVEALAPGRELVIAGQAGVVSVGPVDGGQCLRALSQQPRAARFTTFLELAFDAPHDRFALDLTADQKWVAECRRRIRGEQDRRDRCPGGRRGRLDPGFQFHTGVYVIGRPDTQNE